MCLLILVVAPGHSFGHKRGIEGQPPSARSPSCFSRQSSSTSSIRRPTWCPSTSMPVARARAPIRSAWRCPNGRMGLQPGHPGPASRLRRCLRSGSRIFRRALPCGAPFGLHLLLNVSPEWIEEAGDLHAEDNERNRRLYEEAQGFFSGIPGLVAARMDLDEVGGGVVDLFLAPVFSRTSRLRKDGSRGADIPEISVSKLDALWREQTGERLAYSGLQTLWADHCAERLDPRIQRGRRKSETGREHLTVPEFKAEAALAAALTAEAHAIIEKARKVDTEIQNERAKLGEQRRDLSRQAQIIQSRAHQAETVVARSRQMRTQNRVMHTNLQIAQATIDRQRKDLGLEQVRVLQSIRDENETIKNQLETERADILMWRDTQDLADAASREKDEQLAKEAKSLADRRKQLDEELVLFEAQKQALQRLLYEAAKAEEARKAEELSLTGSARNRQRRRKIRSRSL